MAAIGEATKFFLLKTFDIRSGEVRRSLLMQLNIFLIISTLLIVKPTVNGLFLSRFGVKALPLAFIMVAITAAFVSTLYSRILSRVSLYKISIGILAGSVLSLIFFGVFLQLHIFESAILYIFYIWVAIFALVATSQFWVLANIVFNPREAKRLFGFIGAGAIAGGILGGYITSILAQLFSSEILPFVGAALLSICIPVTDQIWKKNAVGVSTLFYQQKQTGVKDHQHPLRLILKSKHLTYLASIVGVSVMVAKLVDYQFGGIAAALIPDKDELTAFFGFWFATFNVISLLTQLFLTRRVVGIFGVGSSLFFLPGAILIAVVFLFFMPELLMAAVFLKMADGSLKQSINKAAMELLIMPISSPIKNQTKTFIDVFVDSLATGIIGLILIFLINGLHLSSKVISLMIVGLLFFWIYLAIKVRKEYLQSFKLKIKENTANHLKKELDISKESVVAGIKKVLEHGSEKQILNILEKVKDNPDERLFESIKKLLNHPSGEVLTKALGNLYFYRKPNISEEVKTLIQYKLQKVKIAAFEYLIRHETKDKKAFLQPYIDSADYRVSSAAVVSLAKETHKNPRLKRIFDLKQIIRNILDEIPSIEDARQKKYRKFTILKAIGYARLPDLYPEIQQFFSDEDISVVKEAINSAANTRSTKFINTLIQFLPHKEMQSNARNALVHYGKGIVNVLKNIINQQGMPLDTLRVIPSIVKNIGAQRSVNFLFELFEHDDLVVRQEALRGLNTLKNNHPQLKFSQKSVVHQIFNEAQLYQNMLSILHAQLKIKNSDEAASTFEIRDARKSLVNILEKRLDRNLERIFRLLGLKYSSDDILVIYKGLHSKQPGLRINAIEFLDNLLQPGLKKVLIPLVETTMLETISEEAIKNLHLGIPDEYECFGMLLQGRDLRIKLAVLYLIAQLKNPVYLPLIQEYTGNDNEKIRNFARMAEEAIC